MMSPFLPKCDLNNFDQADWSFGLLDFNPNVSVKRVWKIVCDRASTVAKDRFQSKTVHYTDQLAVVYLEQFISAFFQPHFHSINLVRHSVWGHLQFIIIIGRRWFVSILASSFSLIASIWWIWIVAFEHQQTLFLIYRCKSGKSSC